MSSQKPAYLNQHTILPLHVRSTFRYPPSKELMPLGTRLFRFITPGQNKPLGPYWVSANIFRQMESHSRRMGISPSEVSRAWSAVKYQWNIEMSTVIEVVLKQACYGWIGQAKYQLKDSQRISNVLLMGNKTQIFLPNLDNNHVDIISRRTV